MKKKRVTPLLLLILSRTEQVGKCMEWQGMMTGPKKKLPCMWIDQPDGRKAMRSVLLLAWTELYGPPPAGHRVYRTCFNYRCVGCLACGPDTEIKAARKALGRTGHSQITKARIGAAKRALSRWTPQEVERIREMRKTMMPAAIARATGYKRADIFYVLSERFARSSAALGAAGSSVFNMKG